LKGINSPCKDLAGNYLNISIEVNGWIHSGEA
jgi:hypothetical protein